VQGRPLVPFGSSLYVTKRGVAIGWEGREARGPRVLEHRSESLFGKRQVQLQVLDPSA